MSNKKRFVVYMSVVTTKAISNEGGDQHILWSIVVFLMFSSGSVRLRQIFKIWLTAVLSEPNIENTMIESIVKSLKRSDRDWAKTRELGYNFLRCKPSYCTRRS